jgi:hypothetical protein
VRHLAGMAAIALGLAAIDGRAVKLFGWPAPFKGRQL